MTEIIRPSSPALYWREVASTGTAYTDIANLTINAIPIAENSRPRAKKQFLETFAGARQQIAALQESINRLLIEPTLTEPSAGAFALKATIDDFASTSSSQPNTQALDNAKAQANRIEQKLIAHLQLTETPIDYYHVGNALYLFAISLHLGLLFLADQNRRDNNAALCSFIRGLLDNRTRALEVARLVGAKRVSEVDEDLVLIDELGPVWGTNFTIRVDGRVVYTDTFAGSRGIPRRGLNEVRDQARAMRESLIRSNADAVAAELTQTYDLMSEFTRIVCQR